VYNAQYVAYNIPVARGSNELSAIEGAYQNKEFLNVSSIASQLENLESKGLFLAGAAAMETNQFDKAITFFNSLLQKNTSDTTVDYNDDASYYLALAFLKKKDYVQSLALFSAIYKDKQHNYYSKVTEGLLIKIKKLMKN
jgi:tetratricopeptide (TPR) repeat protein